MASSQHILNKKLLRDLWQRKILVIALTIVVGIAITCFTGLVSIYQDLSQARDRYFSNSKIADFTILLKRAPSYSLAQLKSIDNLTDIRTRINTRIMVSLGQKQIPGVAISLPKYPWLQNINKIVMEKGAWFSGIDVPEVIVVKQFAEAHHLRPGDWLNIRLPGKAYRLLIVGVAYSPEYVFITSPEVSIAPDPKGYAVIFLPRKFLEDRTDLSGAFNELVGTVKNNSEKSIETTMNIIETKLNSYGVESKTAARDLLPIQILDDELAGIRVSTILFPSIFLIVAALVVNVLVTRLITQQRTIIGTFKAIGISNGTVLFHFLKIGIFIGICGAAIGSLLGFAMQYLLLEVYKLYFQMPTIGFHIHTEVLLYGLAVSLLTAVLGAISGALKAAKLSPAEAMRPEAPIKVQQVFIERLRFWQHLSLDMRLMLRTIFRNRFRSFVTVLTAFAATALVYSSINLLDSITHTIDFQFNQVEHQDLSLTLRDPVGPSMLAIMRHWPGVVQMESQLIVPAEFRHGQYHKETSVISLPSDNQLFTPITTEGTKIRATIPGIILSDSMAKILHVSVGDTILFKPQMAERKSHRIFVTKIVKTYLGFSTYASLPWMSRLLGNSWLANRILFKIQPGRQMEFDRAVARYSDVIDIRSKAYQLKLLNEMLDQFMTTFVLIVSAFAGAVAISSMLNNALISLSERERYVATLSVLGMSRREIFGIFLKEGLMLNALGIAFGLLGGIGLEKIMLNAYATELFRFPLVFNWHRFYQTIAIIGIFFIVSYAIIYWQIRKVKWLAVLNVRE